MKHGDKLKPGVQDKLTVLRALVDGRGVHIDTPSGDDGWLDETISGEGGPL